MFLNRSARLTAPLLARRASNLNRPSPPPLPANQQREFEDLVRRSQTPLSRSPGQSEVELSLHPDARKPVEPDFRGDVNPATGERGGPKKEPVKKWGDEGDWSHAGRVTDF